MKINVSIEFETALEAADFLNAAVGGASTKRNGASKVKADPVVAPVAPPAADPLNEPEPIVGGSTGPLPPTTPATPVATVASSDVDEFSAPAKAAAPLQFTVPEVINDVALRNALGARMEVAKLAENADKVREAINALIGKFGQAGKNQNSVPQEKRAEFLAAVSAIG